MTTTEAIRLAITVLGAHYDGRFNHLQVGEASKLLEELAQQALPALRAAQAETPNKPLNHSPACPRCDGTTKIQPLPPLPKVECWQCEGVGSIRLGLEQSARGETVPAPEDFSAYACGPTHYQGCSCWESRRNAELELLRAEIDRLEADYALAANERTSLRAELDLLREDMADLEFERQKTASERDEARQTAADMEWVATEAEGRCVDLENERDAARTWPKRWKARTKELAEAYDANRRLLGQMKGELTLTQGRAEQAEAEAAKQNAAACEWQARCEDQMGRAERLREALVSVARWCHSGHGAFPQAQCGMCKPVLAALAGEGKP